MHSTALEYFILNSKSTLAIKVIIFKTILQLQVSVMSCHVQTLSYPTLRDPTDYTVHAILQARILEWVAFPFSRGSFQARGQTQVSRIAARFFTSWAMREAQEYWSGQPILSPGDLPNSGIEPGSPTLPADSLLTELSGKTIVLDIKIKIKL